MTEIITERLTLRPFRRDDLPAFVAYRTDPEVAMTDRETGAVWGDCALRVVPGQRASAELGVTLATGKQGRGLATEAVAALLSVLFEQHRMHRVFAEADDRNTPVHRLLERLGFRCEARLVDADWFKGEWTTLRIYAILHREWHRHRNGGRGTSPVRADPGKLTG